MESALRAVGQTVASLGSPDPRLNHAGNPHYLLQQQLCGYARSDPPASRVKPVPFTIVHHLNNTVVTLVDQAVADIAILGFFFLLRPGEHTYSNPTSDSAPFTLQDVTFKIGATVIPADTGPPLPFHYATFVTLRFSRQKNGTENEIIGHARSGHLTTCPVQALIRRCQHLRAHHALPTTPLCRVHHDNTHTTISAALLTTHLRRSATTLYPSTGFLPRDISARALRAGGAMSLLLTRSEQR